MRSMTGFGRGSVSQDGRTVQLELKSVNHRFLDLSFRIPRMLQHLEPMLRKGLQEALARGHVDVNLSYQNQAPGAKLVQMDLALGSAYVDALREAGEHFQLDESLRISDLLTLPDLFTVREKEEGDAFLPLVEQALDTALAQLIASREAEGEAMQRDLRQHLDSLRALHSKMAQAAQGQPAAWRERLLARLQEAGLEGLDPQRLAQEAAILADRSAVDEELARLNAHLNSLADLLEEKGPAGRRLDFLCQELHREINTIGSKSCVIELTQQVLEAKNVLEKLREQVQNIE